MDKLHWFMQSKCQCRSGLICTADANQVYSTLDHMLPESHFAGCAEYATQNLPRSTPIKVAAYGAAVFPAIFGAADDKGLVLYLFALSAAALSLPGNRWD